MSYWKENFKKEKLYEPLRKNLNTDVCIVGAGLTGLTSGYYLSKSGLKITIVEEDEINSKTSGSTTGKITSQHGLFYNYLEKSYGINFAKDYLQVNQNAINDIKNIVQNENIKCDLINSSSFVFCDKSEDITLFNQEISTLNRLKNEIKNFDLPFEIKYHKKLNIPIKNFGGIEFTNQGMFNPMKYSFGLLDCLLKNGVQIFEHTKVTNIKHENNVFYVTANDKVITSKYVILATHFPIKNFPGMYFLKMYQDLSYVIAIKAYNNPLDGYYINNSAPIISIRKVYENAGENVFLISGNDHKVGRTHNDKNGYKFLEDVAKKVFSKYEVLNRWTTQDCVSMDKLPFVGNFSKLIPNIFVATGFKKWGMTLSNVSARIICDKILNKQNEFEYLFNPSRVKFFKNSKAYGEHFKETVYSIALNKLKLPNDSINDLENDSGKIIIYNGKKVGVYKDKEGVNFLVNPICTHLKCELQFNQTDKTWDCPCHGSRFTYKGKVINNPALYNLNYPK